MPVADTSLAAYDRVKPRINDGHRRVLEVFAPGVKLTRDDIAERAQMKLQTVCARVNELLHDFDQLKLIELPAKDGKHPLMLPQIDTSSETWRHECEVRVIVRMKTNEERKAYLNRVFEVRGEAAYRRLRNDTWEKVKAQEAECESSE